MAAKEKAGVLAAKGRDCGDCLERRALNAASENPFSWSATGGGKRILYVISRLAHG